jgi:hypothetical protein
MRRHVREAMRLSTCVDQSKSDRPTPPARPYIYRGTNTGLVKWSAVSIGPAAGEVSTFLRS